MATLERILTLSDPNDLIIELGDYLWQKAEEDFSLSPLNLHEKRVLLVFWMDAEVNNGGLDQFFFNSTGTLAHETLEALEHMQLPQAASLLRQAIDAFPAPSVPKEEEERREILDELEDDVAEKWEELEDQFYESSEDLTAQMIAYVHANRQYFV